MVSPAGCYIRTPSNVATMVVPPINQPSALPIHAGMLETEWYHSELFLVFSYPDFAGRVLILTPGTVIAQFFSSVRLIAKPQISSSVKTTQVLS
jgi:hypothetical protein